MEVEIFESAKENFQIKKYPDTSVRGLKPGGGRYCHIWVLWVCAAGYGFQAVYSRIGYINQRVWV